MENKNLDKHSFFKKWSKDFSKGNLFFCFILLSLFAGFNDILKIKINKYLIGDLASKLSQSSILFNLLFTSALFVAAVTLFRRVKKRLIPTINSTIFFITISIIYLIFFRTGTNYVFYKFWNNECVNYLDLLLIILFIQFASFKSYEDALKKTNSAKFLIEDSPDENLPDELITREGYAKYINDNINASTTLKSSFAISIIGKWGSGKTDFMYRLEKMLLQNETENIVFRFNPWRVSNINGIVEEFFQTLATQLNPFNHSIFQQIKDYSKSILQTDKEIKYRILNSIINTWFPEKNIEQKFDDIQDSILRTGKRIIVFIDDLDRLTGKEIIEVFKIIRNSANFSNVFFVVSIDEDYVINVLHQTKEIDNEKEYLKKIFQLPIVLPIFKKEIFKLKLKEYLLTDDLIVDDKKTLEDVINKLCTNGIFLGDDNVLEGIIEKMFSNLRDLKRFINSFRISFQILKTECDWYDLMVFELIKNQNTTIYRDIQNESLLKKVNYGHSYTLTDRLQNDEEFEKKYGAGSIVIKYALEQHLLKDEQYKSSRKFINTHNFYIYCSYHLFDLIPLPIFNATIIKDKETLLKQFQEWIDDGKENELYQILESINLAESEESFYKINYVYIQLESKNVRQFNWLQRAIDLIIANKKINYENYFNSNREKYKEFLNKFLDDDNISYYKRASLLYTLLKEVIDDKSLEQYSFTKSESERIILCLFIRFIETNPKNFNDIFNIFLLVLYDIDVRRYYIFHNKARVVLRDYLLCNPDLFELFTRNILYVDKRGFHDTIFKFSFMLRQVFKDINQYSTELEKFNFENPQMRVLKNIILSNIQVEISNVDRVEKSFQITNEEDRKIILALHTKDCPFS